MKAGGTWALVPVKPFDTAKSRLSAVLDDKTRRALARNLLENTLSVLESVSGLSGVAVVSRDPEVAAMAQKRAFLVLSEASPALDALVDGALSDLKARGADSALVVLSDLPELRAWDIQKMLEQGARSSLVIAPDAQDEGTNALFLSPPDRMPSCFGRRFSFQAHLDRAKELGLHALVFRAPSLAFDLDSAEDLEKLGQSSPLRLGFRLGAGAEVREKK